MNEINLAVRECAEANPELAGTDSVADLAWAYGFAEIELRRMLGRKVTDGEAFNLLWILIAWVKKGDLP